MVDLQLQGTLMFVCSDGDEGKLRAGESGRWHSVPDPLPPLLQSPRSYVINSFLAGVSKGTTRLLIGSQNLKLTGTTWAAILLLDPGSYAFTVAALNKVGRGPFTAKTSPAVTVAGGWAAAALKAEARLALAQQPSSAAVADAAGEGAMGRLPLLECAGSAACPALAPAAD